MIRCALVVLALTSIHCTRPHVELKPPKSDMPSTRVRAYRSLRPVAEDVQKFRVVTTEGIEISKGAEDAHVTLGDKTVVWHAEDLLTVIAPTSPTARSARAARRANLLGYIAGVTGGLAALGGLPLLLTSKNTAPKVLGLSSIAVGIVLGFIASAQFQNEVDLTREAFSAYDDNLRQALNICGSTTNPVVCMAPGETPR